MVEIAGTSVGVTRLLRRCFSEMSAELIRLLLREFAEVSVGDEIESAR